MTNKNQKGIIQLLPILILAAALAIGVFLVSQRTNFSQKASNTQSAVTVPAVQKPSDLNNTSAELDKANLDSIDSTLKQNDTDASSF